MDLKEERCISLVHDPRCGTGHKLEELHPILQAGNFSSKIFQKTIELCCQADTSSDVNAATDLLTLVMSHPFNILNENQQIDFVKWSRQVIATFNENSRIVCKLLKVLQKVVEKDLQFCSGMLKEFYSSPILILPVLESQSLPYQCILESVNFLHLLTYRPAGTAQHLYHKVPEDFVAAAQKLVLETLHDDHPFRQRFAQHIDCYLVSVLLSILYNLVISSPSKILGGVILNTCSRFMFLDKSYPSASLMENPIMATQLPEEKLEPNLQSNYTNRNRRRRVNRRKAQPLKVVLKVNPHPSGNVARPTTQTSSSNSWINNSSQLLFQPHWMQKNKNEQTEPEPIASKHIDVEKTPESSEIRSAEELGFDPPSVSQIEAYHLNSIEFLQTVNEDNISTLQAKVRQWSLILINALVSSLGKQNKFSFWPQLVNQKPNLMTCILHDSHTYVRMAALQVLQSFLTDSRPILSVANDKDELKSFTTVSRQYGTNLREIHRCLALGLLSEKSSLVLVRIMKTIELLFENTSYINLKPGLLTKIITHVKCYLRCKEPVVRANAFSVMVSFLMIKPQLEEQRHLLVRHQNPTPEAITRQLKDWQQLSAEEVLPGDDDDLGEIGQVSLSEVPSSSRTEIEGTSSASWIIQRCVDSLLTEDQISHGMYVQVQLQSLKVLSALLDEHLPLVKDSVPLIQHIISKYCYSHDDRQIFNCQNTTDIVPEHSYLLLCSLLSSVKTDVETTTTEAPEFTPCLKSEFASSVCLWSLQYPLRPLIHLATTLHNQKCHTGNSPVQFGVFSLKSLIAASKAFSHLHGQALLSMGETQLRNVMIVTLFLLGHTEFLLRLSGLRIVGLLVVYEAIQQSPTGTELVQRAMDVATDILSTKDVNTKKNRLTAAWALANISGVLGKYREAWESSPSVTLFDDEHICKYLNSCINGSDDKDKIKTHIIRFAGNMVAFIPKSSMSEGDVRERVDKIVLLLIENGTTGNPMKMRWNACHALGNIVSSNNMDLTSYSWRGLLIQSCAKLVDDTKNFKVQIVACTTLCSVQKREDYGPEFLLVWKSLFRCLENTSCIIGVEKLMHREELICQILVSMCHLVELMTLQDLSLIEELVSNTSNDMKTIILKYGQMLPPAKSTCFLAALNHIRTLRSAKELILSQDNASSILEAWLKVV